MTLPPLSSRALTSTPLQLVSKMPMSQVQVSEVTPSSRRRLPGWGVDTPLLMAISEGIGAVGRPVAAVTDVDPGQPGADADHAVEGDLRQGGGQGEAGLDDLFAGHLEEAGGHRKAHQPPVREGAGGFELVFAANRNFVHGLDRHGAGRGALVVDELQGQPVAEIFFGQGPQLGGRIPEVEAQLDMAEAAPGEGIVRGSARSG